MARIAGPFMIPLFPVLIWQGKRVRKHTPRLPEASDPAGAEDGGSPPIRVAVLGDSSAAGVGTESHDGALAGCLAREVAARTGRAVSWRAVARSGATASTVRADLVSGLVTADWKPDLVVIAVGVNDLKSLRSLRAWEADLHSLITEVRTVTGAVPVILCGMPPVHRVPALPQPLRAVMGVRARAMDHGTRLVAARTGVRFATYVRGTVQDDFFATDRFHPGPLGYKLWGESLAPLAAELVQESPPRRATLG